MDQITWKRPWTAPESNAEARRLQSEIAKEVGPRHPLWSVSPKVIGKRIDADDVLVRLQDGRLACVHLVWNGCVDQFPDKYPRTVFYASEAEFQLVMDKDAAEYAEEP